MSQKAYSAADFSTFPKATFTFAAVSSGNTPSPEAISTIHVSSPDDSGAVFMIEIPGFAPGESRVLPASFEAELGRNTRWAVRPPAVEI